MIDLTVRFNETGCLVVPEVKSGLKARAVNQDILSGFGQRLADAQTQLDQIPTTTIGMENFVEMKGANTPDEEFAVFERLRKLNAEVVLRLLVMQRLVVAAQIGK